MDKRFRGTDYDHTDRVPNSVVKDAPGIRLSVRGWNYDPLQLRPAVQSLGGFECGYDRLGDPQRSGATNAVDAVNGAFLHNTLRSYSCSACDCDVAFGLARKPEGAAEIVSGSTRDPRERRPSVHSSTERVQYGGLKCLLEYAY